MANKKSAQKRVRQTEKKTERNRYYRTRIKNITRKLREAVEAKNQDVAAEALKMVDQSFQSFVSKGILKKNTASRKISRLHKLVNSLSVSAQ